MAFVPAINTAEVVIQQSLAGQVVDNVLGFLFTGAITIPDLNILATEVINAWIAELAPLYSTALELVAVKATDLTTVTAPSVTVAAGAATNGDVVEPPTSNNVALCISYGTDNRGRSFRGRSYSAGLPSEQRTDAATMSATYQANFVDGWTAFFTAVENDAGFTHVIISRFTGGNIRGSAVMTEVTQYSANRELDSQRRRLSGRGA